MEEGTESLPLMPANGSAVSISMESEDDWEEELEDESQDRKLFADEKKRGTSLILSDTVLLVLHFLQIYSVVQSLSLRWPWPRNWLSAAQYVFVFNLDVWELAKLTSNGTYLSVQAYFTPSDTMPLAYWQVLAAWAAFIALALAAFVVAYVVLSVRKRPSLMLQIAKMQHVYIILAQAICLPLGTVLSRVFHCTDDGVMDVDNDVVCFKATHWAYMAAAIVVVIFFFLWFPFWMIRRTRVEMLDMTSDRHEGYLQLKETEYVQGLDILYVVGGFHIFSSFKKHGAYLRPTMILLSLLLFVFYAALFQFESLQCLLITVQFGCMFTAFLVLRPYRVSCFNVVLILAYLCLVVDGMLGCLKTAVDVYTLSSPYLTPEFMFLELLIIHVFWILAIMIFLFYVLLRHFGCCDRHYSSPLWPSMTSQGLYRLSPETRKYVRAVLKGRTLIEHVLKQPAMFAPVHELSRQIQIINAYCREAEHLKDPIHDTLWDLLDELIEAHERIAPKSLFADSVKESIRHTASEFMKLVPTFVRRLAQREYDFILMSARKRRMLLKMYCMGVFLNGRGQQRAYEHLTLPGRRKVWHQQHDEDSYSDDGYYEDMYPEVERGPQHRPVTSLSLGALSDAAMDDELALQEAESWTNAHPANKQGQRKLMFMEEDLTAILEDHTLEDDVSRILGNLPNMPTSDEQMHKQSEANMMLASSTEQLIDTELGEASTPLDHSEAPPAYSQQYISPVDLPEQEAAPAAVSTETPQQPANTAPSGQPIHATADKPPLNPQLGRRPGSAAMAAGGSRPGTAAPPEVAILRPQSAGSQTSRPGSGSQRGTPQPDREQDLMRSTPLPGQVQVELGDPVLESEA